MRILFLCNLVSRSPGAFEDLLCALGARLAKDCHSLHLALAGEPCPVVMDAFRASAISWEVITGWDADGTVRPWGVVSPALAIIRRVRPDWIFIHFGNEAPSVVLRLLALSFVPRARWVWVQHQQIVDPAGVTRWLNRIRLMVPFFDRFLTNYEGGRRSLALRGVPSRKVAVIRNGIADREANGRRQNLRAELGAGDNDVVFVVVGSLIERKRPAWLVEAFEKVESRKSKVEVGTEGRGVKSVLWFVGDGPLRASLESAVCSLQSAVSLPPSPSVHFLGRRADVADVLAAADVLVHAATAETCTYVITESMRAGLPAVVTEAGAAREQIENGVTGYVLERDDMDGFAQRMWMLARDGELRSRMGGAARKRWRAGYTLDRSVEGYAALMQMN